MHLKKQHQVQRGTSMKHVHDEQQAQKGTSTSPKNNNNNKHKKNNSKHKEEQKHNVGFKLEFKLFSLLLEGFFRFGLMVIRTIFY